jgi:HPt (histidine-containing phosphotransfer) domain-containing protein
VEQLQLNPALDREQLRDITMDDEELMLEVLNALWTDTAAQTPKLTAAVESRDREQTIRLAHYSKGACANVGACAAAAAFRKIEDSAKQNDFASCSVSLASLAVALVDLKSEIDRVQL